MLYLNIGMIYSSHTQCNIFNQAGRAGAAAELNGTEVFGSRSRAGPPQRPTIYSSRLKGSMVTSYDSITGSQLGKLCHLTYLALSPLA